MKADVRADSRQIERAVRMSIFRKLFTLFACCLMAATLGSCNRGKSADPITSQKTDAVEPLSETPAWSLPFRYAESNGVLAQKALDASHRFLGSWLSKIDPGTGLLPQYLQPLPDEGMNEADPESMQNIWTTMNCAADLLPYMAMAALLNDPPAYNGPIKTMLARERELTMTPSGLPAHVLLKDRTQLDAKPQSLMFNAAEYLKDGLIPLIEYTDDPDWIGRAGELMNAIIAAAPMDSPFGKLPSWSSEVNGAIMQSVVRLYCLTRDPALLSFAQRLADAYFTNALIGNNGLPCKVWDFELSKAGNTTLVLRDHGYEAILGLALLYGLFHHEKPELAAQYRPTFERMLDLLAQFGRNGDGFFYNAIDTVTGKPIDKGLSDSWGYILCAYLVHYQCHGQEQYLEPVTTALGNLDKVSAVQWDVGADGLADAIEGALYLYNRLQKPQVAQWIDARTQELLALQKEGGVIEGTYQDGNFARTAMMVFLMKTAGVRLIPRSTWTFYGAHVENGSLFLALRTSTPYTGRLVFDSLRYKTRLNLPANFARVNEWPIWWAAQDDRSYRFETKNESGEPLASTTYTGAQLVSGIPVQLEAGQAHYIQIDPIDPPEAAQPSKTPNTP